MRAGSSVVSQVLAAFCAFGVLIAVAAIVGYAGLARQNAATRQLTGRDYVLQEAVGQMDGSFTISQLAVTSYALSGQRGSLAPVRRARAAFTANLRTLNGQPLPPPVRGFAATLARCGADLFAAASTIGAAPPGSAAAQRLAAQTARPSAEFYAASDGMQGYLAGNIRQLTGQSKHALSVGLAWSAAAIAVAVALILVAALASVRGITGPLRGVTTTVRRLTSGEYTARAIVTGSAEVREVAEAVNTMAAENDRLRGQEQDSTRLQALAREAGVRIREHVTAEAALGEASIAITQCVHTDLAVLRLVDDDQPRYADCARKDWLPVNFLSELNPGFDEWAHRLLANQSSAVIQDVRGRDGDIIPPSIREPLLRQGVVAHLATPFGVGSELYGVVELERTRPGNPWTAAEVNAVESLAADLGRGLKYARLHQAEDQLMERLKALDQAQAEFFATVSQQLRSPLTSIEGYLEMLRDQDAGRTTAAQERMLETIARNVTRLRSLIDDLLTLSKIESAAFQTTLRPVNLLDIIRGAVQAHEPSMAATGLTLTVSCPEGSLAVSGDVSQLDRVVMNLLSNAAKFTSPGGSVQLTARRDADTAVLSISDTGIGIPEKDKEGLFERFFRATNAVRQSIPGTGLGLTIVATIVAEHGGTVDIQSTEGVGTTVTVRFPLLLANSLAAEPVTRPAAHQAAPRQRNAVR
jgi:signal transduction histidine kinase/CHASE3 domain sensor protein